ncbi:hypothetical protein [Winogradskyella flava]|uniref:Uncharacterized protein n=1 Tax=Winogradskyella flava TaxID=1884876 RepID=A0A842IMB3_9FLAO|nr:hypothetical protein [Winogradskyella flava]MBC2843785.1 hypothetical protein [Winogradskyella flava]
MNFKKSKNVEGSIRIIDVKRTVCLMLVTALFSTFGLNAQTTPKPPTPPNSKTSTSKSYAIEIDTDDEEHNSSVSISISDDSYKFKASYHKSKNNGVKTILLNQLGKSNLNVNGNTYLWSNNQSGNEVFECKLTNGRLRMYVDTEVASKSFVEKINKLGNNLKYYISGTDAKKESEKAAAKAKRELERAERELERAKREAERTAREAKRTEKN